MESDYYDLGGFGRPVSTTSAEAQMWFDRGLIWCYGFNHEEALRCFAATQSPQTRLRDGYWGIAYAVGPNFNKDWRRSAGGAVGAVARGHRAVAEALRLADPGRPWSRR